MSTVSFVAGANEAQSTAATLRTTHAVRERCGQLLARARAGESKWFTVEDSALDTAAREIADTTRQRYPRLHIPYHSRWRHFEAGGVNRKAQLDQLLAPLSSQSRAHAMVDLTFVSVLLDGGAGPHWKYVESASGQTFTRSEGLAVASFHAFTSGLFSSDKDHPCQIDAAGLRGLATDHLAAAFQVNENNPLVGLDSRAILLRRFGEVMAEQPEAFGDAGRPSGLFDLIIPGPTVPPTSDVAAHDILSQILLTLSGIWPSSNFIGVVPLGDCWQHEAVRGDGMSNGWVPFHKLSQWLTYSLLEPFEWAGVKTRGLEQLTALPEYRNGGLMIDSGLLRLRDDGATRQVWQPGDEIIVEWRALTLSLMDEVAVRARKLLHMDEHRMPLACVLEGGSWAAGRALAQRHRNGLPPLQVASDGTVF